MNGRRVVVTRPEAQAGPMCRLLRDCNGIPISFPTVEIVAINGNALLDRALQEWEAFDWVVFTSANGVEIFFDVAHGGGFAVPQRDGVPAMAAIGPATAAALEKRGYAVHAVPGEYVAEEIAGVLGDVSAKRILLPRAKRARRVLPDQLTRNGALVVEVATYDTTVPSPPPDDYEILSYPVDAFTFTSSSTVDGLLRLLGDRAIPLLEQSCVACIGPVTANTARRRGIRVDVVATQHTAAGLVDALVRYFGWM